MTKEFLTYNQQMKYLRDMKNIECSGSKDKTTLVKQGYFNLINGYKQPFISGRTGHGYIYMGGTTLQQIYKLKCFDDNLRMTLLKYITQVEEEIRNLVAYKFDELNGNGKIEWYDIEAYDSDVSSQNILKLISDSYNQVRASKQNYIKHYLEIHKYIPTWILIKTINFSTIIDFIECSKRDLKVSLCELYDIKDSDGNIDIKLLIGSLNWMRKVRNACAHNERIYGMCRENGRINVKYFRGLARSYSRERKQTIFDLIVYFRFFLENKNYKQFINEMKKMLDDLRGNINYTSFNKVRADMGIKDIEHLNKLLEFNKKIEYNKF